MNIIGLCQNNILNLMTYSGFCNYGIITGNDIVSRTVGYVKYLLYGGGGDDSRPAENKASTSNQKCVVSNESSTSATRQKCNCKPVETRRSKKQCKTSNCHKTHHRPKTKFDKTTETQSSVGCGNLPTCKDETGCGCRCGGKRHKATVKDSSTDTAVDNNRVCSRAACCAVSSDRRCARDLQCVRCIDKICKRLSVTVKKLGVIMETFGDKNDSVMVATEVPLHEVSRHRYARCGNCDRGRIDDECLDKRLSVSTAGDGNGNGDQYGDDSFKDKLDRTSSMLSESISEETITFFDTLDEEHKDADRSESEEFVRDSFLNVTSVSPTEILRGLKCSVVDHRSVAPRLKETHDDESIDTTDAINAVQIKDQTEFKPFNDIVSFCGKEDPIESKSSNNKFDFVVETSDKRSTENTKQDFNQDNNPVPKDMKNKIKPYTTSRNTIKNPIRINNLPNIKNQSTKRTDNKKNVNQNNSKNITNKPSQPFKPKNKFNENGKTAKNQTFQKNRNDRNNKLKTKASSQEEILFKINPENSKLANDIIKMFYNESSVGTRLTKKVRNEIEAERKKFNFYESMKIDITGGAQPI